MRYFPSRSDPFPELGRNIKSLGSLEAVILKSQSIESLTPDELLKVLDHTKNPEVAKVLLQDPQHLQAYILSMYGNHFNDEDLRRIREGSVSKGVKRIRRVADPITIKSLKTVLLSTIISLRQKLFNSIKGKDEN